MTRALAVALGFAMAAGTATAQPAPTKPDDQPVTTLETNPAGAVSAEDERQASLVF